MNADNLHDRYFVNLMKLWGEAAQTLRSLENAVARAVAWAPMLCLLVCPTSPVHATEGGGSNYTPGFYGDLGMAAMPDKGLYFYNFFAGYGDRGGNAGTMLEMPGLLWTNDKGILGGRYIAGFFPGVMGIVDDGGAKGQARFGLGDAYIVPFGLTWRWGDVYLTAFEGIMAPFGRYTKGSLNPGRNVWSFDHMALLTWNLPGHNELSMALGYTNNTYNHATHYSSGDELHFDYTLGHYFRDDLGVGIAGSYYKQVTADQAPDRSSIGPYSEFATIGPVALFTPRIAGKDVTMSLKWLHEYNVTGRPAQNYLIWRVLVGF